MQWLNLIPENQTARPLSAEARRAQDAARVTAVAACAKSPRVGHDDRSAAPQPSRQPVDRRRQHDRRRRQVPVVLDTRCGHDRRARPGDDQPKPVHLDLYA